MDDKPKSGFFRDDGTEINPSLIVKPSLCVSCKKDDDIDNNAGTTPTLTIKKLSISFLGETGYCHQK